MGSVPSRVLPHRRPLIELCALTVVGLCVCASAPHLTLTGKSAVSSFPTPASAKVHSEATKPQGATPKTSTTIYTPTGTATTQPRSSTSPNAGLQSLLKAGRTTTQGRAKSGKHQGFKLPKLTGEALYAAALAALLILLCIAWAIMRWLAFEPHWMLSTRHSMAEASYRLSATFSEFADWIRLGH